MILRERPGVGTGFAFGMFAAIALTGCTTGTGSNPERPAPIVETDPNAAHMAAVAELPQGPCRPAYEAESQAARQDKAKACLEAQRRGRIALIDFTESGVVDAKLARTMESTITHATHGLIKNTVVIKKATPAAKEAFEKAKGPEGCVDTTAPRTWGSTNAEIVEGPHKEDFVVAVSDSKACGSTAQGVAGAGAFSKMRHAEVLLGDVYQNDRQYIANVATHEQLHNYRLGHSGSYSKNASDLSVGVKPGKTFDLAKYLQGGAYYGYGRSEHIMGNGWQGDFQPGLDPVHIALLRDPARITKGMPLDMKSVDETPVGITMAAAQKGAMAKIEFSEQVTLTSADSGANASFDQLIIVPRVDEEHNYLWGADLILHSSVNNDIVNLGNAVGIMPDEGAKSWYFSHGNTKFMIKLAGGKLITQKLSKSPPA